MKNNEIQLIIEYFPLNNNIAVDIIFNAGKNKQIKKIYFYVCIFHQFCKL